MITCGGEKIDVVSDALLAFDFHLRLPQDYGHIPGVDRFCGVGFVVWMPSHNLPLHKVYSNFYQEVFFYFKPVGFAPVISSERNIFLLIHPFILAETWWLKQWRKCSYTIELE